MYPPSIFPIPAPATAIAAVGQKSKLKLNNLPKQRFIALRKLCCAVVYFPSLRGRRMQVEIESGNMFPKHVELCRTFVSVLMLKFISLLNDLLDQ